MNPVAVPAFEGISALGERWEWRTQDAAMVGDVMRYLEIPELLARVLVGRGQTPDTIPTYLNPTLRASLPDPYHLKDMDKAVDRLQQAVEGGETIGIFGDYDVDGATSSALLVRYFRQLGREPLVHIPDRHKEGYGPNAPALLALQTKGATLVITVDCGAVAFTPLAAAADAGLDVIVLDHHKGAAQLPRAVAVVNPNRLDEHSPHTHLAAVGVTFLTLVALNKRLREMGYFTKAYPEPDLMSLLDIVALGTVCDVVPLTGVNRSFVSQGLRMLSRRCNAGLDVLLHRAGIHVDATTTHAGFIIGPRINAGGRVGKPDLGVRLLTCEQHEELQDISAQLETHNQERQAIEAHVLLDAMQQAEAQANYPMILVGAQGWHSGVIGIVASRIKDRFNCPAAVVSLNGEAGKASGRSVSGVDMGAAIVAAREQRIITEGGGHAMAGGFSLHTDRMEEVHRFFMTHMEVAITRYHASRTLKLDGFITASMATQQTIQELERAAPYGMGNPSPVLVLRDAVILDLSIVKEQHLRMVLTDASGGKLKAMCFRSIGTPLGDSLLSAGKKPLHLAGSLKQDVWQNRPQITFMVQDVMKTYSDSH